MKQLIILFLVMVMLDLMDGVPDNAIAALKLLYDNLFGVMT